MTSSVGGLCALHFAGVRIVESFAMVDHVEDWSRVRSPGRARRRRKLGYRQNIEVIAVPKKEAFFIDNGRTAVMHPEMATQLRQALQRLEGRIIRSNSFRS